MGGRLKDGCNPHTMQDVGCTLQGVIDGMQDYGCCSEDIWKYYPTSINRKPSSESYTKAKQYRVTNAMQIPTNLIAMKSCLADGYPFTFGLNLFESFHRAATNKGRVPMPESWERQSAQHGYHALVAAGYSDRSKCFIVRNSWGTQWGDKGYCYIPYAYMSNPQYCQDIYVIKRISSKRSHPQKYAASNPNESHDDDLDVPFDHTQFWSQNDSYNYYIGSELTNDPNNFIIKKKYNGIACDFTPFIIWIDTKTDLKDIIERKLETTHKAEFEFCQTFSQGIDYVLQYNDLIRSSMYQIVCRGYYSNEDKNALNLLDLLTDLQLDHLPILVITRHKANIISRFNIQAPHMDLHNWKEQIFITDDFDHLLKELKRNINDIKNPKS